MAYYVACLNMTEIDKLSGLYDVQCLLKAMLNLMPTLIIILKIYAWPSYNIEGYLENNTFNLS